MSWYRSTVKNSLQYRWHRGEGTGRKGDVEGPERGGHERVKQRTMKRGKKHKEVIWGTERGKEEEES
jgi:hypothetical protein